MLQCSFGAAPAPFVVLPINRVSACNFPSATIMDNIPIVNITPFGMCQSPSNPTVIAATAAALGVFTPMPCVPVTVAPWTPGEVYEPSDVAELERRLLDTGVYDSVTVALAPPAQTTAEGLRPVVVSLADRDPDRAGKDLTVVLRESAGSRRQRPEYHAGKQHMTPVEPVRKPCQRNGRDHGKQGRAKPLDRADAQIAQGKIALHGLDHQGENLAIDKTEHSRQRQNAQRIPCHRAGSFR